MMRFIIGIVFLASFGSVITGFALRPHVWSEKLIGFGVLAFFFIVVPLFSYHRWKDKKMEDYMLTKENIEKMRKKEDS